MSAVEPCERISWLRPAHSGAWEFLIAHSSSRLWTVYHETYTLCASVMHGQRWNYRGQIHSLDDSGVMLMEPGEIHRTLALP